MRSLLMILGLTASLGATNSGSPSGAGYDFPVLSRFSQPGFVPPDRAHSQACRIYSDRIELTERQGETTTNSTIRAAVDVPALEAMIVDASKAPMVETLAPTDIPFTTYRASAGSEGDVPLRIYNGSDLIRSRDSASARTLMAVLDGFCGADPNQSWAPR